MNVPGLCDRGRSALEGLWGQTEMPGERRRRPWCGVRIAVLALLVCSCTTAPPTMSTWALSRSAAGGNIGAAVQRAALEFRSQLEAELAASDLLAVPYPLPGAIVLTPDPADPNRSTISCEPGAPAGDPGSHGVCLLLTPAGSFAQIRAITWQSAAVFQHRLYVMPRNLFARVDPTRDFRRGHPRL